jgi:hypothetical protein
MKTTNKKMTRAQLAEVLAEAMNLLNDLCQDDWTNRQKGDFHSLAKLMPESVEYWNNGTVFAKHL